MNLTTLSILHTMSRAKGNSAVVIYLNAEGPFVLAQPHVVSCVVMSQQNTMLSSKNLRTTHSYIQ